MIAISLTEMTEIASGRASKRRPKEPKKMLSRIAGAQRNGPPAPQAELGKTAAFLAINPKQMGAFLVVFSLFENSQLNFLYFQKIDDDGQKMAKAVMIWFME